MTACPEALLDLEFFNALPKRTFDRFRLTFSPGFESGSAAAPALLFVHGGYHGAWCYANYVRHFSDAGMPCAAIDLQGHGGLPQDNDFMRLGLRDFAAQIDAACDALGGNVVLVGHSLGAVPTSLCASWRRVAGVVLLAPSPPGNLPGARPLASVPTSQAFPPFSAAAVRDVYLGVADDPSFDVSEIMAHLCAESPRALNDRYALRIEVDPTAVRAPGLCVEVGLDSPERHPAGQDKAVADFFAFSHHVLDRMPHCLMYAPGWQSGAQLIERWYRDTFN